LRAVYFSFGAELDLESDHIQFAAFKDDSILNFDYDAEEGSVAIEFHK
jgi:hypothetical protein